MKKRLLNEEQIKQFTEIYPHIQNIEIGKLFGLTKIQVDRLGCGRLKLKKTKEMRSGINKGRPSYLKGKTYEEVYGVEKAKELKKCCYYGHKDNKVTNQKRSSTLKERYKSGKIVPHNKGKTKENYEPLRITGQKKSNYLKSLPKETLFRITSKAGIAARKLMNGKGWKSKPQTKLTKILRGMGLDIKEEQFILSPTTNYYQIDCFCPSLNIAFECDGERFHDEISDQKRDRALLETYDIKTHRFDAQKIMKEPQEVINKCKMIIQKNSIA